MRSLRHVRAGLKLDCRRWAERDGRAALGEQGQEADDQVGRPGREQHAQKRQAHAPPSLPHLHAVVKIFSLFLCILGQRLVYF